MRISNSTLHGIKKVILLFCAVILISPFANSIYGATASELRDKIDDKTSQIQDLEKSIKQLNAQIETTGKEKASLQNTIKTLDATAKKLTADLDVTKIKINRTDLSIEKLGIEIDDKSSRLEEIKKTLVQIFKQLNEADQMTLLETFLSYGNTSELWNQAERLNQLKTALRNTIIELEDTKTTLESNKKDAEAEKRELARLKNELDDRKKLVAENTKEKNKLLSATQSKEAVYKKSLEEKKKLQEQFQAELFAFEAELKQSVNLKTVPPSGAGILSWPVDSVYITQKFGYTDFAKNNPVYNGNGHNGVDFRAAVGTPLKASLSGVVEGTGDTDIACSGASYGRWVLIRHYNGLSSLYAHLSLIKVKEGQTIQTGDLVGYSGNTGYTTGPHLHFSVFATDGVAVNTYQFRSCAGASVRLPRATKQGAYLDPLKYL